MIPSITTALGAGSGIDTQALIENLSTAVKAPKEAAIKKREDLNAARITSLGEAAGAIDSFAAALSQLVSGGTLFSQPTVSDATVLGASAVAGSDLGSLNAQLEVTQLAGSQTLVSQYFASEATAVGTGTTNLTVGSQSYTVTITAANNSLAGFAQAINDTNSGVTASIVTDANGARLVLKGRSGAANAFSLAAPRGGVFAPTPALAKFDYAAATNSGNMTRTQTAQDAIVKVDGVEVRRATNSFSDVIAGVQIDLKKAAPGTVVTLGVQRPSAAIKTGVEDFVFAYNELHALLAKATASAVSNGGEDGPLRRDNGIREMQRELARLTTTAIASGGSYATLAEIGVATNRDGTLRVDAVTLERALSSNPDGVEALFNPRQHSSSPNLVIASKYAAAKAGTYTLTNMVAKNGATPASGTIDGAAMIQSDDSVIAPTTSKAAGLIVRVLANTASATITVDLGLGGALKQIRDELQARTGPLAGSRERYAKETRAIADDRIKMEARHESYRERLTTQFSGMERRVNAFKATQSYLDQQIKMWANDD